MMPEASNNEQEAAVPEPAVATRTLAVASGDAAVSTVDAEQGRTSIADVVVAKVAGVATRQIPGVYSLGSGAARALGSLRERIPGQKVSVTQGVAVEVGARQAAVDIDMVVEYGYRIAEVCDQVRISVIEAVEGLVGLEVTEVNIAVNDVHLPGSGDEPAESRVQ